MLRKFCIGMSLLLSGCAPAAIGGIGSLGMSAAEDRGLDGVASDQALRVKLNFQLEKNLSDFTGIELTVYKGRVLLTGVAGSEKVKADAVRVAKRVKGVRDVIDGMNVRGEDGFSENARDAWITTKLKSSLYTEDDVIAPNFMIRTFDKIIYIFGTAQNTKEMNRVLQIAREITGVRRVVNLIEVKKQAKE